MKMDGKHKKEISFVVLIIVTIVWEYLAVVDENREGWPW